MEIGSSMVGPTRCQVDVIVGPPIANVSQRLPHLGDAGTRWFDTLSQIKHHTYVLRPESRGNSATPTTVELSLPLVVALMRTSLLVLSTTLPLTLCQALRPTLLLLLEENWLLGLRQLRLWPGAKK